MALSLDAFAEASRPRRSRCSVSLLFDRLDEKDRTVLDAALANPDVMHSAIERVLAAEGHKLAQTTIARHRRGECACDT